MVLSMGAVVFGGYDDVYDNRQVLLENKDFYACGYKTDIFKTKYNSSAPSSFFWKNVTTAGKYQYNNIERVKFLGLFKKDNTYKTRTGTISTSVNVQTFKNTYSAGEMKIELKALDNTNADIDKLIVWYD